MKIGIIGLGNMGAALAKAFSQETIGYDIDSSKSSLVDIFVPSIESLEKKSNIIIIAVKPQHIQPILTILKNSNKIIVSIAAGISLNTLENGMPNAKIIRVMPNTPCLVNHMAAGFSVGKKATSTDIAAVKKLFEQAGIMHHVAEKEMDIVTALSGSGPAYFAFLVEQFVFAAEKRGLDKKTAFELARKTMEGTAVLLQNTDPEKLIAMVSSPNGTTVAGRKILETKDLQQIIDKTIDAAYKRSKELRA